MSNLTEKHLAALALHIADAIGCDATTARDLTFATVDDTNSYAEVSRVTVAAIGESIHIANASRAAPLRVNSLRREALAGLFRAVHEGAPVCETCGRLGVQLVDGEWIDVGRECPKDHGLFNREEAPAGVVAWSDGALYDAGTERDRSGVPITDAAIRKAKRVHAWIDSALQETNVALTAFCGALVRAGRARNPVEALNVLVTPDAVAFVDQNDVRLFARSVAQGTAAPTLAPQMAPVSAGFPLSRLDARATRQLVDALVSAFPSWRVWEEFAKTGLGVNLHTITGQETTPTVALNVIGHYESRGSLGSLVSAAVAANPGNPLLRAFVASVTASPADPRQVRATLVRLYPETKRARLVARDARLAMDRIDFAGDALTVWQAILDEAQKSRRLPDLLAVVRVDYPTCGL